MEPPNRHETLPDADWGLIPEHMIQGVCNYLFYGIPPGSFLRAVLENNFVSAARRADEKNREALFGWCCFLHNHIPIKAWGDPKTVDEYIKSKQKDEVE